jgi:hypothetical protein
MTTRIAAGTRVRKGYYFNLETWALTPVDTDGRPLPGDASEDYVHVPLLIAFVLAPVMGAAFLMFLPFIGFYLAGQAALVPVTGIFRCSATELAATLQPGWQPGEAHLTGQPGGEHVEGGGAAALEDRLDILQREIDARRRNRDA